MRSIATRVRAALACPPSAALASTGRTGATTARRLVLAALLVATLGSIAHAEPLRLLVPQSGRTTRVRWERASEPEPPIPASDTARVLAKWSSLLRDPDAQAAALQALARLRLARRDTLRADSCWRALVAWRSIWQWEARRGLVELALARSALGDADSLLAAADRVDWPEGDRAGWLALRVRTRLALRDTSEAVRLARQAIRLYPSASPTREALESLSACLAARGEALDLADQRAAAEVEVFRGRRREAAAWLRRAARAAPSDAERFAPLLRSAEILREGRQFSAARIVAREAELLAPDSVARARAVIEQARCLRDGRRPDSSFVLYERAAGLATTAQWSALAHWEWAREAEDQGRWQEAIAPFRRVAAFAGARSGEARFRAGLMHFLLGAPDSARAWWVGSEEESARFWWAISMRGLDRPRADSVLRVIALAPGFSFYRACARDTLGVHAWPGLVASDRCAPISPLTNPCRALSAAERLLEAGFAEDAMRLLSRWLAGDPRASSAVPTPEQMVAAASIAFRADRPMPGGAWTDRAVSQARGDSMVWALVPWSYPPAYEELFEAYRVDSLGLDRYTLMALARQESRFERRARSSSNALGLMQFVRSTAREVARWFRDPRPTEERLFRPEVSIRYGSRYLTWLVRRFDGRLAVALAAYNAGPGTIPPYWRELVERGGEALFCELASNADSQDYARKILGYREGYRELQPTLRR